MGYEYSHIINNLYVINILLSQVFLKNLPPRILASIRKICGCVQEPDYDYEEDHYTNYEVNDPPYKDVDADEENQYLWNTLNLVP